MLKNWFALRCQVRLYNQCFFIGGRYTLQPERVLSCCEVVKRRGCPAEWIEDTHDSTFQKHLVDQENEGLIVGICEQT